MSESHSFRGGVYPLHKIHEGKPLTRDRAITPMPAPAVVKIPLSQHIGAPAKPVVEPGQRVKMGQVIGAAQGVVSAMIHASVSGTVREIAAIPALNGNPVQAVVIENDGMDESEFLPMHDVSQMNPEQITEVIKQAGIVGMGGATFPTHVKLSPPKDKNVNLLIVNGAECEPFLTADDRQMREYAPDIVEGVKIVMQALGVGKAFIGIEENKPEAIESISKALSGHAIRVIPLKTKYPQGGEKQLINAITGRVVPSGGLPADAGVVVHNIGTIRAVADALLRGKPLFERVVTVTGAVQKPQNLMVRIGTSIQEVLDYAGGFDGEPLKILSGGPMMGWPVPTLECVVIKSTSGLLVLDAKYTKLRKEKNCIQCGRCSYVCPMHLMPMTLVAAASMENFERAEEYSALDCINCGACSFICPANKPIAQSIQFAKEQIMKNRIASKK